MQFKSFEPGIEVNGQTVFSILDGMGTYRNFGEKILYECGIGVMDNGKYYLDLNEWYSQDRWLDAFREIAKKIGDNTLKKIGYSIPENAKFPPWVKDIRSAIQSINIAYHMNHRKNGAVMFNPDSEEIIEGIGNYGYEEIQNKKIIICECNNPYPCKFDYGIISSMARKFELTVHVSHDDSKPCRKNEADSCTYIITW